MTWDAGSESDKAESSDAVLETDGAAEVRRHVTNDRRQSADDQHGHGERRPAAHVV